MYHRLELFTRNAKLSTEKYRIYNALLQEIPPSTTLYDDSTISISSSYSSLEYPSLTLALLFMRQYTQKVKQGKERN
jgi:hypothetical protein